MQDSLCSGCRQPRDESFAIENSFAYAVTALECHACAARERRAHADHQGHGSGSPIVGRYYAVMLDND